MKHTCQICRKSFSKPGNRVYKYCSRQCDFSQRINKPKPVGFGEKVSAGNKGNPRPWQQGSNNQNYGNKGQKKYRKKFLLAIKNRVFDKSKKDNQNNTHSIRMQGASNWMRGKKHSTRTKQLISRKQKQRYRKGKVFYKINISKAEKKIHSILEEANIVHQTQYSIPGIAFVYDFYIPELNLIIEYNGNYWHMNPKIYRSSDKRSKKENITAKDIWKRDRIKLGLAKKKGFNVEVIWESQHSKSLEDLKPILVGIVEKYRR